MLREIAEHKHIIIVEKHIDLSSVNSGGYKPIFKALSTLFDVRVYVFPCIDPLKYWLVLVGNEPDVKDLEYWVQKIAEVTDLDIPGLLINLNNKIQDKRGIKDYVNTWTVKKLAIIDYHNNRLRHKHLKKQIKSGV